MKRHQKIGHSRPFGSKALARILPFPVSSYAGSGVLLGILSCILILMSAVKPQATAGIRTALVDMSAPVIKVVSIPMQTAALFVRDVSGLAAMQSENARLKEENARLRDWYQTALLLEAENKSLRDLLNVKIEPQNKFITARILSDAGRTFAKSLLISAGEKNGVKKGQAVLSAQGVIGRIIEVGQSTARVLLITDINSRVPVLVEDSRLHAIFSGENEKDGKLSHLPPDSNISDGARIITSGHGGVFPYGLPIGVVKRDENSQIRVLPFADFNRLVHVRIIDKPTDPYLREGSLN